MPDVLVFDGSCGRCSGVASEAARMAAGKLQVRSARDPWIVELLGTDQRPTEPLLLRVRADGNDVLRGVRMRVGVARRVGVRNALRLQAMICGDARIESVTRFADLQSSRLRCSRLSEVLQISPLRRRGGRCVMSGWSGLSVWTQRVAAVVTAFIATAVTTVALVPSAASASTANFCARLVAETANGPGGFNCPGPALDHGWTFTSDNYYGGGNIDYIRAAQYTGPGPGGQLLFGVWGVAHLAVSDTICYVHGSYPGQQTHGTVGETDFGASHTLYGGEDDSLNHTGCVAG